MIGRSFNKRDLRSGFSASLRNLDQNRSETFAHGAIDMKSHIVPIEYAKAIVNMATYMQYWVDPLCYLLEEEHVSYRLLFTIGVT